MLWHPQPCEAFELKVACVPSLACVASGFLYLLKGRLNGIPPTPGWAGVGVLGFPGFLVGLPSPKTLGGYQPPDQSAKKQVISRRLSLRAEADFK